MKFHACRTAILMEFAYSVHLVTISFSNILHDFECFLCMRHRRHLRFVWPNDVVINSRMIEHIGPSQKFIGLKKAVNLSRLRMRSISFLLKFLTRSLLVSVINLNLWAAFGIQAPAIKFLSILLHSLTGFKDIVRFVEIRRLCIQGLVEVDIQVFNIAQGRPNRLWDFRSQESVNLWSHPSAA